jgi:hypothetical protein
MRDETAVPDHAFVADFRSAVERYFEAVDQWETAYRRYYRQPDCGEKVSADLETEHSGYCARRRELEQMLPRARRLCLKHGLREPFSNLQRISLGRYAPQQRTESAIGRDERRVVTNCLLELDEACREWPAWPAAPASPCEAGEASLLQRLVNFFF